MKEGIKDWMIKWNCSFIRGRDYTNQLHTNIIYVSFFIHYIIPYVICLKTPKNNIK